ncbi:N-acetyltransferase family protein [Nocardia thailandica]|uniref:GNAT family N-acetyltransferase n=1 Tax=Nocardia thailandica TaxID=257275 RepID=A0ABW6PLA8_9NOCA|nr:N-acetyltransferase [Nocardia thailandica]
MTIRPGTRDDAESVAALHTASWRLAYAGLLPADFLAGPVAEDHRAMWRERLSDPPAGAALFVAEGGDGLGGFVYLRPSGDRILLDNLHVRPDGKRRGLGSALFAHALDWSRATAPGRDLYLEVLTGNTGAIAFYERLGGLRTREGVAVFPQGFEVPEYEYVWAAD